MVEPLDPKKVFTFRHEIAEARAADATAQRLTESYVRLFVLANAGGMLACLGIADALAGGKGSPGALSFAALTGPMWFFLFGLIFGGLTVSVMRARAVRDSVQHGERALQAIRHMSLIVPTVPSPFSHPELKALPHLDRAIDVLGIASPACFLIGAIWGLIQIGTIH